MADKYTGSQKHLTKLNNEDVGDDDTTKKKEDKIGMNMYTLIYTK